MGENDTADLVKCGKCGFPIHPSETGVRHFGFYVAHSEERCTSLLQAALSSTQARADKLEAELVGVKRENERLAKLVYVPGLSRCAKCNLRLVSTILDANSGRMAHDRSPQDCPNGCGPMWRVTERDAGNELIDRAESAESSLAQANEALKAVNKLIEWERENGTHFALLGHEVEHVSGLWMDAKNAVIPALKAPRS